MAKTALSERYSSLLNDVLKKLKNLLAAESASLFLFDREHQELVLDTVFDERKIQFKGIRRRIGEGVAGSVASGGKAVLVKDIKADQRFHKEYLRHYHTDSFICIPIATQEGLAGIINISDKATGRPFTDEDFELACFMARMISYYIENEREKEHLKVKNDLFECEKSASQKEQEFLKKFASIGKLAGGIVHEINNPLDAVMRYVNMLMEKDLDAAIAKEYLSEIKVGLARITKITRSLLEFSRQLKDTPCQETVDIHDAVNEALSLFRHIIVQGHIRVEKSYASGLPRVFDKGLCHLFSNLIKNAFDAMPEGGVLSILTDSDGEFLTVSFRDTGCGISDEVRDRIFTPFFTTKPPGRGIGLGLPICFEIVQRYGGKFGIESRPGQGSEFKIFFPVSNPSDDKPSA